MHALAEAVGADIGVSHHPCFIADAWPRAHASLASRAQLRGGAVAPHPSPLRHAVRVGIFLDCPAVEIAKRRKFIEGRMDIRPRRRESARGTRPSSQLVLAHFKFG